jgi:hypothetical protein
MVADYIEQTKEMFTKAGFIQINAEDTKSPPGADVHEVGVSRNQFFDSLNTIFKNF